MTWLLNEKSKIKCSHMTYVTDWNSSDGSKGERAVRAFLRDHCSNVVWLEQFRIPKTLLRVDFLSPALKLAVEFDGESHYSYNKFHHKGSKFNFLSSIKRDDEKEKLLKLNGYTLVRFTEKDLPLTLDSFKVYGIEI